MSGPTEGLDQGQEGAQAVRTPWAWEPPAARPCLRCQTLIVDQALGVRCPKCGLVEGT